MCQRGVSDYVKYKIHLSTYAPFLAFTLTGTPPSLPSSRLTQPLRSHRHQRQPSPHSLSFPPSTKPAAPTPPFQQTGLSPPLVLSAGGGAGLGGGGGGRRRRRRRGRLSQEHAVGPGR